MHEETAKRKNTRPCKNLYGDRRRNLYFSIHFCCLCRVVCMRNPRYFEPDMGAAFCAVLLFAGWLIKWGWSGKM